MFFLVQPTQTVLFLYCLLFPLLFHPLHIYSETGIDQTAKNCWVVELHQSSYHFGPMDPFTPVLSVHFCTLFIVPGGKAAGAWR